MIDVDKRLEWIRSQYRSVRPQSQASPALFPAALPAQADEKRRRRERAAANGSTKFATQPYQQLANVYLAAGRDADARKVAIARRRDLRAFGNLSRPAWFGNWLLDFTIRYGYRTWRAVIGLAILFAIVVVFFSFFRLHGGVIPVQTPPTRRVANA
jgi:hypothetical protein